MTEPPLSRRIAFMNNKGGVGKSMFVVALAEALAARGRRVLAVDMDPQANATRRLGVRPDTGRTLADVLRPSVTPGAAAEATYPCGWDTPDAERIQVVAAELALEDRALEAGVPGAVHRLAEALYGASDIHDYVLIDCPPSMGPLTQMAMAACDHDGEGRPEAADTVLIPIVPEWDAVAGARRVVAFVATYRKALAVPHLAVSGLLVNAVRPHTTLHGARVDELTAAFPDVPVWTPAIPQRARVAEVQDAARPLSPDPELRSSGLIGWIGQLADRLDATAAVPA